MSDYEENPSQPSIAQMLERLRSINFDTQDALADNYGQQLNQLDGLARLGLVISAPKAAVANGATAPATPELPLLAEFVKQIEFAYRNYELLREQVNSARFIGNVIHSQISQENKSVSAASAEKQWAQEQSRGR